MSDLSPQARRIIELGKDGQDPSAAERDRVRAALATGIAAIGVTAGGGAAAAAGAGSAATTGGTAGSLLGIKLTIATVVAIGAAAGGAAVATRASAPPIAEQPPSEPRTSWPRRATSAPVAVPQLDPVPAGAAPVLAPAEPRRVPAAGSRSGSRSGSASRSGSGSESGSGSGSGSGSESGSGSVSESVSLAPPPSRQPAAPAVESDEALVMRIAIQADRKRDWQAVLAATAIHAARHPRSPRALQRDSLRAVALCRIGRTADGRALLGHPTRWAGTGPLMRRIIDACGIPDPDDD